MSCPAAETWLSYCAGEAPPPVSDALEAHARSCARCRGELAFARALQAPSAPAADTARLAAAVMRATSRPAPSSRALGALAAGLLAVVAVGLAARWRPGGEVTARGGEPHTWQQRVIAELRPAGAVRRPVLDGEPLARATRWAVWYRNAEAERPLFLLAYLVDAAGELHWLTPAYRVEGQEPAPAPLPTSLGEQLLGEVVQFDAAAGPATLVTLVGPTPGSVLAFEAAPATAQQDPAALLPGAVVWRRTVTLSP